MGLFGGGGNQARRAGEQAAKNISFTPQALNLAGVGSVGVNQVGDNFGLDLQLPGQVRDIQNTLFGGADPALSAAGGLVGPAAANAQSLFGAGGQALSSLGSFDPLTAASDQFKRLEGILNPIRERETAGLEARLARQGILGGTSGINRLGERSAAIERERQMALLNQFQAAQQAQGNLAGLGVGLTQAGQGIGDSLFGRGVQSAQAGQQLSGPLLQLLGQSANIGQASTAADIAKSNAITGFNQQQAGSGGGGLGGALSGLAGGALGSFLGPAGTAAGAALGGLFGDGGGGAPAGGGGLFTGGGGGGGLFGIDTFGFQGLNN